mmetsp:Transcript_107075/g.308063  ORF Transcript_107075/g.308063 Transcript_107075/m.308063 type:complete len:230 (+) Transcript_107075:597-1286(+)
MLATSSAEPSASSLITSAVAAPKAVVFAKPASRALATTEPAPRPSGEAFTASHAPCMSCWAKCLGFSPNRQPHSLTPSATPMADPSSEINQLSSPPYSTLSGCGISATPACKASAAPCWAPAAAARMSSQKSQAVPEGVLSAMNGDASAPASDPTSVLCCDNVPLDAIFFTKDTCEQRLPVDLGDTTSPMPASLGSSQGLGARAAMPSARILRTALARCGRRETGRGAS